MTENLKELLQSVKPELTEEELEMQFEKIAREILTNYIIRKGDITYQFMEIEFYYFNNTKGNEHLDLITYPRCAKAGDWFFHASGVDICFDSPLNIDRYTGKVKKDQENMFFGGILIRSLKKNYPDKETKYLTGPQKCCYDLFDKFSASDADREFPMLEFKVNVGQLAEGDCQCKRYFKFSTTDEQKYENIIEDKYERDNIKNREQTFGTVDNFRKYLSKSYRWYNRRGFDGFEIWRRQKNSEGVKISSYGAMPKKPQA